MLSCPVRFCLAVLVASQISLGGAQTINVPNGTFESGADTPDLWTLSEGAGAWYANPDTENHAVSVTGTGADTNHWRSAPLPLEPSTLYEVRFRARRETVTNGTAISGPIFCNRDLGTLTDDWITYRSLFVSPSTVSVDDAWVRFGQWHVAGTMLFDDVSVTRVQPVYGGLDDLSLGTGERIAGRDYEFQFPLTTPEGNVCRPLLRHNSSFNTNRWAFGPGSEVVYEHQIGSRRQTSAHVDVDVGHWESGSLVVQASPGNEEWQVLGNVDVSGVKSFDLPASFFPAEVICVRLRGVGDTNGSASFQVEGYVYTAQITGAPVTVSGKTQYLAIPKTDHRFEVACLSIGDARPGGTNHFTAIVRNRTGQPLTVPSALEVTRDGEEPVQYAESVSLADGTGIVRVPYAIPDSGTYTLAYSLGGPTGLRAETSLHVSTLFKTSYGKRLPGSSDRVGLWWASSGWKISRDRPVPAKAGPAMLIRAARNEAEAAQLVIRPESPLRGLTVSMSDLAGPRGVVLPATAVDILRARYVDVARPTDGVGVAAPWPDPLPPFTAPIDVDAGVNQPLWVRVNVPQDVPPGSYRGTIHLSAQRFEAGVPLRVDVFAFKLPVRPTCTTAFGFSPGNVYRYQKISDPNQRRQVLEMYWRNFSAHRISPYDPAPGDPFSVTWPGVERWKQDTSGDIHDAFAPVIDWTAWDAAMTKAIDEYGFNSFRLPIVGMGGGTFHSRTEPSLLGYAEDAPEYQAAFTNYCQMVQEHLREKGWLDEAFVYWFDEPDPKDYDFVMNGFCKIKEAAPDIHRMLTEQVESALIGGPNIWCPISFAFDMEDATARRIEGEEFWWYVCTAPKTPYCTLFIDHPATELRVWLWQTWQRKIDGILVWQSNYWTSNAAYPDALQNPYADPMGWTSGYSTEAGAKRPWGNGDGRFIYPPEAAADAQQAETVIAGPVDSIRWEMLRDGVEDYEYLAMLRRLIAERERAGDNPESLKSFRVLLEVPPEITSSMTDFTQDPAPIEERREAVARAIETLSNHNR